MANRLYRRAAMTAVCFTVGAMAGAANAQVPFHNYGCPPDHIYQPSTRFMNQGECMPAALLQRRNDRGEVSETGTLGRMPAGAVRAGSRGGAALVVGAGVGAAPGRGTGSSAAPGSGGGIRATMAE